jgi:2-methylisocitrate lyase-like PEP mutase family enzyme
MKRLEELGVRRVSLPRMLPAAAILGMKRALATMQEAIAGATIADRPDLVASIEDIMELMDYEEMRALERQLLSTEALSAKYGSS